MKKLFWGIIVVMTVMFGALTFTTITASAESDVSLPYIIKEGTSYYESSYKFGSGRTTVVNEKNEYTTVPCYAGINGYSFLDGNGNVLTSAYCEDEEDIVIPEAPEDAVKVFLHFKTSQYRNGWIDSGNVIPNNEKNEPEEQNLEKQEPKEQEPEEIISDIRDDIENGYKKTTLVIDFSGSMSDHQRQVVELLETLEFNVNTKIIVFADEYEVITHEQLVSRDFRVGSGTYMIQALNEAVSLETEHLIIISDLDTADKYSGISLKESETLESVVVYDPDDGYEDEIIDNMFKVVWKNVKIRRIRIK